MIVVAFIVLVVALVVWLMGFLPTEPAPPDLSGMVDDLFASDLVYWARSLVSTWFPLDVLGSALAVLMGWWVALAVFRMLAWFLALIHVGGTEAT